MEKKDQFYEEFCKEVMEQAAEMEVAVEEIHKEEGHFISLCFDRQKDDLCISPDLFYHEWKNGVPIKSIVRNFLYAAETSKMATFPGCLREMDKSEMKRHLKTAIVNYKRNKQKLEGIPHERIEDLAVFIKWDFGNGYAVVISRKILPYIGIGWEELFEAAKANMADRMMFKDMNTMLAELLDEFGENNGMRMMFENPLYILTDKEGFEGASLLADTEVLKKVQDILGGTFYILPSSIHELIIFPKACWNDSPAMLYEIVFRINRSEVPVPIRLSDNVYEFDGTNVHIAKVGS